MARIEAEGRWEFDRNIGTGGFGLVKLFTNQVYMCYVYSGIIRLAKVVSLAVHYTS